MHFVLTAALYGYLAYSGLKKQSLSVSGALAAGELPYSLLTTHPPSTHFTLCLVLLTFYLSSSKLTKVGNKTKVAIEEDFKVGGQRTAVQVFSNGFTGTVIACLHYMVSLCFADASSPSDWIVRLNTALIAAYIGHYACCNGDTWASELGVLSHGQPFLITTFKSVPKGTNGGVSAVGLAASVLGGALVGFVGALAFLINNYNCVTASMVSHLVMWGAACGLVGSLIDSMLGATLQRSTFNKRTGKIAPDFRRPKRHEDKADLVVVSGWELLDNHQVNFVSSLSTAILAGIVAYNYYY
ncbi:integral membrane protein DUF92-domain-containing protein [Chytriomyces sp. MP71]|nr:integral membrane protein DUF92-domain-containing protein [Chytriomyces sp. MP71]